MRKMSKDGKQTNLEKTDNATILLIQILTRMCEMFFKQALNDERLYRLLINIYESNDKQFFLLK